jgi:hypothetical protein
MKMIGWLSKLIITAILLSTMSVMTTIYIVDQYVQTVLERFQLTDVERPPLRIGGLLQQTSPSLGDESKNEADAVEVTEKDTAAAEQQSQDRLEQQRQQDPQVELPSEGQNMTEATPVFGGSIQSNSLVMTPDEFNEKRKNLSDEDKMMIFSIMMNKLPQAELQKLSEWLEDGITEEELTQVEEVINAYLEQADIDKLLSILNRY